jgi:thiamine-phosphate pyrophosphorylase
LELATEHLLLGIASTQTEVTTWLKQRGLHRDQLEREIHRLYGHDPGPLVVDWSTTAGQQRQQDGSESDNRELRTAARDAISVASTRAPAGDSVSHDSRRPAIPEIGVLRIIDAAANRASEGLRVVEDFVRFALDDRHLTALAKQMRHDLTTALAAVSTADRLAARDTPGDVGTGISTSAEQRRPDAAAVVNAALQRVQQALRSLEEFAKLFDPGVASQLESLRYRAYTIGRAILSTSDSLARLADARLYVLIDGRGSVEEMAKLAEALVGTGVHVLQFRDKRLSDRSLLACCRRLREITARSATLLVMNDRPDLAALVHADGVHVGQDELGVKEVRQIVGPRMLVGVSTHSIAQARRAVIDGANYIGVGPTFSSSTKSFPELAGLAVAREVAIEIRLPAFAIGGIGFENLAEVLATGIGRVAVSGAIVSSADPVAAARQMLDRLQ